MTERIDPETVNAVFLDCLFKPEELIDNKPTKGAAVMAEGILYIVGFHRRRLNSHRKQVKEWLMLLPTEFRKSVGGGWSFVNACEQADGLQWTGLQQRMDQLFTLGLALGLVTKWNPFPGEIPYFRIEA